MRPPVYDDLIAEMSELEEQEQLNAVFDSDPIHASPWVSDLNFPVNTSAWVPNLAFPVYASSWVSDSDLPVHGSPWVSDLNFPVNTLAWVPNLTFPAYASPWVSDLNFPVHNPEQLLKAKCDEMKPACNSCTSINRGCDDYELPLPRPTVDIIAPLEATQVVPPYQASTNTSSLTAFSPTISTLSPAPEHHSNPKCSPQSLATPLALNAASATPAIAPSYTSPTNRIIGAYDSSQSQFQIDNTLSTAPAFPTSLNQSKTEDRSNEDTRNNLGKTVRGDEPGCGKSYSSASNLGRHKRGHSSGLKKARTLSRCTHLGCGKSYSTVDNLRRHINNHHIGKSGDQKSHRNPCINW